MADLLRVGLRTATIVTIGATGWLVSVLVTIVPARDPRSEHCGSPSRPARRP
jgi:hypothetical protein